MSYAREQSRAMRRAQDMDDLAGVLEGNGEHVLAGATRKTARVIRALWDDPE
ncbi:MAG: hypothetical protein A4E36_00103 [Methanoregulaceae archaeon PtaB.Bin009]|jgi:hypothetical protein|nr:MAG: hypothetical protein A4E36_00103 [Methanoregulaceae archaeon PtaB.Bin009]OPY42361.1 MAG: hypothetical protein A4E41_00353 [Methanoregulaceae archaeon PtaU1.Bin066]